MPDVTTGADTYVASSDPARNFSDKKPRFVGGNHRTILAMSPGNIANAAIPEATLSGRVVDATPAQRLTVGLLNYRANVGKVTWNRDQDGGVVSSVWVDLPALAAGARFEVNIQPLLQLIANGAPAYGFRISSNASSRFKLRPMAANDSWEMSYEMSLDPEAPTGLKPSGGSVGSAKPFVTWSPTIDQVALRVQMDADGTGTVDWDSGEVASAANGLDLAATSFSGIASGASKVWRVQTKGEDGIWSPWSDWSQPVTYIPWAALVPDNPAAGVIYDPTTTLTAHQETGTPVWWTVSLADSSRRILWTSGQGSGAIASAPPEKWKKKRLLVSGDYFAVFRWSDRADRVESGNELAYRELWVPFTFGTSASVVPPSPLIAEHLTGTPLTRLTWSRPASPDAFLVRLDGDIVARLEVGDWTQDGTIYTWDAPGLAAPHHEHTWDVQAIENKIGSTRTSVTQEQACVPGVTLIRESGTWVTLEGPSPSFTRVDRRDEYQPLGDRAPISILRAREFRKGTLSCQLDTSRTDDPMTGDERLAELDAIEQGEWGEVLQVMYADRSDACRVMDLLIEPVPDDFNPARPIYTVTGSLQQVR